MGIKLGILLGMLLLVALVFTSWQITVDDYEQNYIVGNISQAENVSSTFKSATLSNQTTGIQDSFSEIINETRNPSDEDAGFKIVATLVALLRAFVLLPVVLMDNIAIAVSQMSFVSVTLGIPAAILAIGVTGLTLFIVLKIINAKRKYEA